jgi:GT2 family glycosyltransferase
MSLKPPQHVAVVLNWYGREDTLECVRSLREGSPEVAVVVVDNGSFDGTLEAVAGEWSGVKTLQLAENLGFAGGMNRGIRHALGLGAEVVTVLNNDTVVPAGAMRALRAAAGPDVAVSPEVMYRSAPDRLWFGGGTLDRRNAFPHHTDTAELPSCRDGLRETTLLAGCCITARASVWEQAGLFDERFFLNFEDSEWSLRASARGIRMIVACGVRILHAVSASFQGTAATLGTFYYVRNGLLFNRIVGGDFRSRARFVWRSTRSTVRGRTMTEVARTLMIVGWALTAHLIRQYGPAPAAVQRRATSWNTHSQPRRPQR